MSRTRKIVIAVCALAVLGVLGAYGYILFIKDDAPAALDESDLDAALGATTVPADSATTEPAATETTTAAASDETGAPADGVDGVWNITDESTLGYRVSEVLGGVDTEGAGRTNQVTGTLTIEGTSATAAEFTVDMASVTSDESRRDGARCTRCTLVLRRAPRATGRRTRPPAGD